MRTPSVERFAEARGNSPNCRRSFRLPESNYNVEAGLPAESANCRDVAGNEPAFSGDQQAHRNAFRFVVVGAMQQVGGPHSHAKTQSRPGSLPGGSTGHEGTHDGVDFAEALVQAALGGDGVGGDQSGEDADVHFVLDRPETMLAGRIGKCGTAARREALCVQESAQQKNREEVFHGVPDYQVGKTSVSQGCGRFYGPSSEIDGRLVRVTEGRRWLLAWRNQTELASRRGVWHRLKRRRSAGFRSRSIDSAPFRRDGRLYFLYLTRAMSSSLVTVTQLLRNLLPIASAVIARCAEGETPSGQPAGCRRYSLSPFQAEGRRTAPPVTGFRGAEPNCGAQ